MIIHLFCIYIGSSNDKVKDLSVAYSPDPPIIDKDVTIFFSGNLSKIAAIWLHYAVTQFCQVEK